MSPSIAILLAALLKAGIELLEKELSEDEKKESDVKGEEFAAVFIKKDTETV